MSGLTSILHEIVAVEAEIQRLTYARDPVRWARDKLNLTLWSKQREILQSVAAHRRTAVHSCHEVGKSFIAAGVAAWWLDTHAQGDAFVVTSAPTASQVRAILWREIGRMHTRGALPGRLNQTEWFLSVNGKEELVAFGRKPDEYDPTAFQGIHAPYVLFIFDEACGIRGPLWEAADSLIANDQSKALVIGNPDDPQTEFAAVCQPGSGYHVIRVSAFDTPNFTGEPLPESVLSQLIGRTYVEEKRKKWAPGWRWTDDGRRVVPPDTSESAGANPLWYSKVLGEFPQISQQNNLIPWSWIRAAQERVLVPDGAHHLGVDVGGGSDESTIAHRRGPVVRVIHSDQNPDTMATCGRIIEALRVTGAETAKIDEIGIGRGVVDRGREQAFPFLGVNVGEKAKDDERFANLRAELYWHVRTLFEMGLIDIDPLDEDLASELAEIRFERTSRGQVKIESKREARARGVKSPNRADALMLAMSPVEMLQHGFFAEVDVQFG